MNAIRKQLKFEMLRDFPWQWAFWWVLLPNLAIVAMWPVGGPSMAAPMFFCGLMAIVASQRSSAILRVLAMLSIFLILLAFYATKSFNVGLGNIAMVDQYLVELRPAQSPEYLVAGVVLAIAMGLALRFGTRTRKFGSTSQFVMAIAAVALLVNADTYATAETRGSYKAKAPAGTPIDSAILQNHIGPSTVEADNLIVIIVESWGVPANDFDRAIDHQVWDTTALEGRYEVSRGISEYYGSTTNAEVREWCAVWADHMSFDFDNSVCLPEAFRRKGFATKAFHSFNDQFFRRGEWYPKLGFEEDYFDRELTKEGARFCDGVFPGVCDTDVPKIMAKHLKESKSERNLLYWLTLNAHLPVGSEHKLGSDDCKLGNAQWREDFPMLCRSYAVHQAVAKSIFEEINAEDFPEADILIVGDHMPPFFPRNIRTRFDSAHVPWLYLKNRAAGD